MDSKELKLLMFHLIVLLLCHFIVFMKLLEELQISLICSDLTVKIDDRIYCFHDKYSKGANLIGFPRTEHFVVDERRAFKYANDS